MIQGKPYVIQIIADHVKKSHIDHSDNDDRRFLLWNYFQFRISQGIDHSVYLFNGVSHDGGTELSENP